MNTLIFHQTIAHLVKVYDAIVATYEEHNKKLLEENALLREENQKLATCLQQAMKVS